MSHGPGGAASPVWSRLDAIDRQLDAITVRLGELAAPIAVLVERLGCDGCGGPVEKPPRSGGDRAV